MPIILALIVFCFSILPASAEPHHALAMNGAPKYGPDFTHFDYANPDAPKGGTMRFAAIGTFDSFNPFIAKGNAADGLDLLFDTLTVQALDEPFTEYGLVAERMDVAPDGSGITFFCATRPVFILAVLCGPRTWPLVLPSCAIRAHPPMLSIMRTWSA